MRRLWSGRAFVDRRTSSARRSARRLSWLVAAGVAVSLLIPTTASAWFPRSGARVRNWAPEHIGRDHSHTRRQALATAKAFDLVVAVRGAYQGLVDDMRSVNRNLVVLVYLNGTFAQNNQGSAFPARWYARTAGGDKIRSKAYGNYLMLPSSRGWRDHVQDLCARFRSEGRYDGCFLDMLGTSLLEPGYLTGRPIDPATGNVWTKAAWLEATSRLARGVRNRIDPRLLAANGLRNGNQFYASGAPSSLLLPSIHGGGAESWLRVASQGVNAWPSEEEWLRNVRMLKDASADRRSVLVLTKLWVSATDAQRQRWHRFALASFLLGDGDRSYFYFSGSRDQIPTRSHPWWKARLGPARGGFEKVAGVYQRVFEYGRVLVNPSGSSLTVDLGGRYAKLSGAELTRITLGPYGAEVLTEA